MKKEDLDYVFFPKKWPHFAVAQWK